jgi:hypothetical protein
MPKDDLQLGIPANYQETCASLTEELEADCVMLVVVGGIRGEGFCVSARQGKAPDLHGDAGIARYLRALADRVEKRGGRGVHLRPTKKKGQQN